jgi:hypothetical protein
MARDRASAAIEPIDIPRLGSGKLGASYKATESVSFHDGGGGVFGAKVTMLRTNHPELRMKAKALLCASPPVK